MKVLITSTSGDAKELLESLGILAEPSEYPNYYFLELENLEDLLSLPLVLGREILLKEDYEYDELEGKTVLEIYYNDKE